LVHYALANSLFAREPAGASRVPDPTPETPGLPE